MKNDLMADILNVPAKKVEEVTARSGSKHRISVEVLRSSSSNRDARVGAFVLRTNKQQGLLL